MMKNLLTAVAMLVAVSASAQHSGKFDIEKKVEFEKATAMQKFSLSKSEQSLVKAQKSPAKALGKVYTTWVATELSHDESVNNAFQVTMEEINEKDEEGNVYNVKVNDFYEAGTSMLGIYDTEAGTLRIPAQEVVSSTKDLGYTTDYGPLGILSIKNDEKGSIGYELVFVEDEGAFVFADSIAGYYIYAPDYDNGDGSKGTGWAYAWDVRLAKANGLINFSTTAKNFMTSDPKEDSSWGRGSYAMNFQNWDTSVQINGFPSRADGLLAGCISIDLNDDGTATMMMGQQLSDYSYGQDKGFMRLCGVAQDEATNTINVDPSIESISGGYYKDVELTAGVKGDVIVFYTVDDNGYYKTNEYICPLNDSQEYWIGGFFCGLEFDLFPFNLSDGILENHVTLEQRLKNTKTFNLMGQQVNRADAAKGMLIRGGKKYIKK